MRAGASSVEAAIPGIDERAVSEWLRGRVELEPPLDFSRIGEGQSNLTYRIDGAAGPPVVLRRAPLGEILASAHDVVREHRILAALAPAGAPVPRPLALCIDRSVTGAPFYVMEHVEGLVLTRVATAEALPSHVRETVGSEAAATLAGLHAIDVDAVGLADFRRPESLASRQLRRWSRQWEASKTRELPLLDDVRARLADRLPEERETVLLHGDYHLHNLVLADDGSVRAVLDWELCTVGDPLADVGQMVAYWEELARGDGLFRDPVVAVPGFAAARDVAAAYADCSGRSLEGLEFWVAFSLWKIAIIIEGVYRRWLNDPVNGSDAGSLAPTVARLTELAHDAIRA
jgi:aminoglycoside phosphotransferase (APT) family kinase protein